MTQMRASERDPRESLRRLQAMIDAVADYEIIELDADGTIDSWNPGARALAGYTALDYMSPTAYEKSPPYMLLCRIAAQSVGCESKRGDFTPAAPTDLGAKRSFDRPSTTS